MEVQSLGAEGCSPPVGDWSTRREARRVRGRQEGHWREVDETQGVGCSGFEATFG